MKTPLEILHKYFHHFNSERTRDLVVRAMEDYANLYHETEVKKLQQHSVMQGLLSDCCQAAITTTEIHYCKECECSCSPTVGQRSVDTGVSAGCCDHVEWVVRLGILQCANCGKPH